MKYSLAALTILTLSFLSCDRGRQQHSLPGPALKESDGSAGYKRGSGNVVDDIYRDLLENDKELMEVQQKVDNLKHGKSDSLKKFEQFDEYVSAYYRSADFRVASIRDSGLRANMKLLMQNSLAKYTTDISKHKALMEAIDNKNVKLADLHQSLILVRTLPIIEKYQADQKPSIKPMENYAAAIDKVNGELDSVVAP